jgi:SAM-dependent methyltransferase
LKKRNDTHPFDADYWDSIVTESNVAGSEDFWRAHMRELYQELQERWAENGRPERILKTDLYDEAISAHNLVSLFAGRCDHFIGTDVSLEIARAAKRRMAEQPDGWDAIAVSDARNLAFRSGVFDGIISNSTLDHFPDKRDITESLREFLRVMRPGGTLVVTLDNPWNPVVFLRNRLPYRLLRFLGVIPFYMGATLSTTALVRVLEPIGFRVCESTAIAHAPRIVAIRVGRILDRRGGKRISGWFRKLLRLFERLEGLPTRYMTGYYVAVKAVKR